jgi:hypothetical protein
LKSEAPSDSVVTGFIGVLARCGVLASASDAMKVIAAVMRIVTGLRLLICNDP